MSLKSLNMNIAFFYFISCTLLCIPKYDKWIFLKFPIPSLKVLMKPKETLIEKKRLL